MAVESLGYEEGYIVDVDIPEGTWAQSLSFHDILIFNTGHCSLWILALYVLKNDLVDSQSWEVPAAVGLDSILKRM
ncbi:hypothetical protein C3L33_21052, partial [Rhododendron williamsianum]